MVLFFPRGSEYLSESAKSDGLIVTTGEERQERDFELSN